MISPLKQINNIYGYVRVSTKEQVRSGVSLEVQQQQITDFVKEKYNRYLWLCQGIYQRAGPLWCIFRGAAAADY